MDSSTSWFSQGRIGEALQVGNTIFTSKFRWRILDKRKERDCQVSQEDSIEDFASYASIKLLCAEASNPSRWVFMRIYMQVPLKNTENEDAQTRALQAIQTKPKELIAYQTLANAPYVLKYVPELLDFEEHRQGSSNSFPANLVPGGFLTIIVWEHVPGVLLGDGSGKATKFWDLKDPRERVTIREKFKELIPKITKAGIWPKTAGPSNLIWCSETKSLHLVGFREWSHMPRQTWNAGWYPRFDLVRVPVDCHWSDSDWNGSTSGWKWELDDFVAREQSS
ncbi:uncharacterized protein N7498_007110 [Penicillium cinerascens]|uniref:Uncharacterized protein n=1 Tax=Penicillium cinerascens TaxID=70096 RepID=A0A9W9MDJ0_9EURO|nr:uncharacterized protein N7498_007110 [Penicillium cinerascens]KAJ5197993.1 hypothetical protein N7498_007110 [Penicillium cinerascens]